MSRYTWAVFLAAILGLVGMGSQIVLSCIGEGDQCISTDGKVFTNLNGATSGTLSVKLSDLPVGKVIQIGELKFVKVSGDQYLSVSSGCADPVLTTTGAQKLLTYTGNYQSYTFHVGCEYQIELWGASGGNGWFGSAYTNFGKGAYVSGNIFISSNRTAYFYLGGQGVSCTTRQHTAGGYNGGGDGVLDGDGNDSGGGGGGATDIRLVSGTWNNATSLISRAMVASGGGGASNSSGGSATHGAGIKNDGTLNYYSGGSTTVNATQTSGYKFGIGQQAADGNPYYDAQGGSGAGWYGASFNYSSRGSHGAGGSSYISGHTGCVAVTSTSSSSPKAGCTTGTTDNSCSISPYGYTFTDTVMIDGAGYQWTNVKGALKPMPNPTGGNYASGVGHAGNGYARITRLN